MAWLMSRGCGHRGRWWAGSGSGQPRELPGQRATVGGDGVGGRSLRDLHSGQELAGVNGTVSAIGAPLDMFWPIFSVPSMAAGRSSIRSLRTPRALLSASNRGADDVGQIGDPVLQLGPVLRPVAGLAVHVGDGPGRAAELGGQFAGR